MPKPLATMAEKTAAAKAALASASEPKANDYFAAATRDTMIQAVERFTTAKAGGSVRREVVKEFSGAAEREFLAVLDQQWAPTYDAIVNHISAKIDGINRLANEVPPSLANNPATSGDFSLEKVQALHSLESQTRWLAPKLQALVDLQPTSYPHPHRNGYGYAQYLPLLQLINPADVSLPYAFEHGHSGGAPAALVRLAADGVEFRPQQFEVTRAGVLAMLEAERDWTYRPDRPEGQRWTYHDPTPAQPPFPAGHVPDEHELRQLEYGRVAAR